MLEILNIRVVRQAKPNHSPAHLGGIFSAHPASGAH
jgi:hypothetical protein